MKCIYCDSDTKYQTRQSNGRRCGACGHAFAYEPKSDPLSIADKRFQRILRNVSGDDTLFFTERELWYEFSRNLWRKPFWKAPWGGAAVACGAGGLLLAVVASSVWPLAVGILGVAGAAAMSRRSPSRKPRRFGFLSTSPIAS